MNKVDKTPNNLQANENKLCMSVSRKIVYLRERGKERQREIETQRNKQTNN